VCSVLIPHSKQHNGLFWRRVFPRNQFHQHWHPSLQESKSTQKMYDDIRSTNSNAKKLILFKRRCEKTNEPKLNLWELLIRVYAVQHRTVLTIFCLILYTIIMNQRLFTGEDETPQKPISCMCNKHKWLQINKIYHRVENISRLDVHSVFYTMTEICTLTNTMASS